MRRPGARAATVQVRWVITRGTVEEKIWDLVCRKQKVMKETELAVEVWRDVASKWRAA